MLDFGQAKPTFKSGPESSNSSNLSSMVHGHTSTATFASTPGSLDNNTSGVSAAPQPQPRALSTASSSSSSHHSNGSWRASFSKATPGGGGSAGHNSAAPVEVSEVHAKRVKVRFGEYSGLCRELALFCGWFFFCVWLFTLWKIIRMKTHVKKIWMNSFWCACGRTWIADDNLGRRASFLEAPPSEHKAKSHIDVSVCTPRVDWLIGIGPPTWSTRENY